MSNELARTIEDVWDDGNCVGLDGWIGPARGAGEVDSEAMRCRERATEKASAAILAAGYRRPRTITKQHEIETLPVGSVLRDAVGRVWGKRAQATWGSTDGMVCLVPTLVPATVLHEPEAAK